VRSPHIVRFYGATLGEPHSCVVMELCARGDLLNALQNTAITVNWKGVLDWATQIVEGINCLHNWEPQIVHRDLKTLNLLLGDDWNIKIADFGLSRFTTGDEQNLTTLGKLRGTYTYTAPEVYLGVPFSTKSDIYSLGIILWEIGYRCVIGSHSKPYSEYKQIFTKPYQILMQAAKQKRRPSIPPLCPSAIRSIITVCWAEKPEDRPSSNQLLSMLDWVQNEYALHTEEWDKVCADASVGRQG